MYQSIFTAKAGQQATWSEAMAAAGMDWTVSKHQFSSPITGQPVEAWGIFRDDTNALLGSVGPAFQPVQNREMGTHIDGIINAAGAKYETAGALNGGSRVWALARLPQADIRITGTDDITKSYLLAAQGHDGTLSYILKYTGIRVVCRNTLTAAIKGSGEQIKTKHTANVQSRLTDAIAAVKGIGATIQDINRKLNELALRKVNKETCRAIMAKVFGEDWTESERKKNQAREIAQLFEYNDGNAFPSERGTAYNLYNAMTNWSDHVRTVRRTDGKQEMQIEQLREESAIFGTGEAWKADALENILKMTENAPRREEKLIFQTMPSLVLPQRKTVDNILSMVA
jgi:phage/plasmid-like protein (TIGR03299 family)